MAHIFVSYARENTDFVNTLAEELQKRNFEVWVDQKWEDQKEGGIGPAENWMNAIEKAIEGADTFLAVITKDWIESGPCNDELKLAVKNGKRLIPVVPIDLNWNDVPKELAQLNYIFFREIDDFNKALEKLEKGIRTDFAWVQKHRWLQVRASEWQREKKDRSYLVRGKDLKNGENFISQAAGKEPQPTPLQVEYIVTGRNVATAIQLNILAGVVAALVISIMLGILAWLQRQEAVRQAVISRAGELAALGISEIDNHFDLALLFSLEGINKQDNTRTRSTLLTLTDSHPGLLTHLSGHQSRVSSVAFNPKRKLIASGSIDGTIFLWDVSDPTHPIRLPPLNVESNLYLTVAFHPDGNLLASGSADGTILLWDVSNPSAPSEFPPLSAHTGNLVTEVKFSPDGKNITLTDLWGTIAQWNITDPAAPSKIEAEITGSSFDYFLDGTLFPSNDEFVLLHPTESTVASKSPEGTITLLNVSDPAAPLELSQLSENSPTSDLAFSPTNELLASGSLSNAVILWNISNPKNPSSVRLRGHNSSVTSVAFSPDGNLLASGSIDGSIILWNVDGQAIPSQLAQLPDQNVFAYSPDGTRAAIGSADGSIRLLDINYPLKPIQIVPPSDMNFDKFIFGLDGNRIGATSVSNDIAAVWDITDPENPSITDLTKLGMPITNAAFRPDLNLLASGGHDGSIILWNATGPASIPGHHINISSIAFSSNGKQLAVESIDGTITVSDISDPTAPAPLASLSGPVPSIHNLVFSPFGRYLTISDEAGSVVVWDLSNRSSASKQGNRVAGSSGVAFNQDDTLLATGTSDGTIYLWDLTNSLPSTKLAKLTGHTQAVTSMEFSQDGQLLVSASYDGSIILSDISDPRLPFQIARLSPNTGYAKEVAFALDGKSLISQHYSWGVSYTIILWDLDPVSWKLKACQRAGRNFTRAEWAQYFPEEEYRKTCEQWPLEEEIILK